MKSSLSNKKRLAEYIKRLAAVTMTNMIKSCVTPTFSRKIRRRNAVNPLTRALPT